MRFGNPVDGHIYPLMYEGPRERLPNGRLMFRMTQTFDHINREFSTLRHGAIDLGNFNCGDRIIAAAAGSAVRYGPDKYGALAVIIDHGVHDGATWRTRYWHVDGWVIPTGTTWVKEGQPIAILGDTGLGAICHLHFEVWRNGVLVDPWPLLRQNQAAQQEGDVRLRGKFIRHIINRRAALATRARFRIDPDTDDTELAIFDAGTSFLPVIEVQGESVDGHTSWFGGWMYLDPGGWTFGYYSEVVLTDWVDMVNTSGITEAAAVAREQAAARNAAIQVAAGAQSAAKQYTE